MFLALHGQNLLDEKNSYIGGRGNFESILFKRCYSYPSSDGSTFLNLLSNKHYLVQFLAKLWASTANIKGMGVL